MTTNAKNPTVHVRLGPDGNPAGAAATTHIARPVSRVWGVIADLDGYPGRVPMIDKVRREGDRITVHLKFKVGFFSVGFTFTADAVYEAERWLELRYVAGEPRDIRLRFDLEPAEEGRATLVRGDGEFDVHSLGWLTKYFLKHHPEIQYGIFPGVALALIDSMRRAAEES